MTKTSRKDSFHLRVCIRSTFSASTTRLKFPTRQKIIISKKWGFTNVARGDYLKLKEEKKVMQYVLFSFHFFRAQSNLNRHERTRTHVARADVAVDLDWERGAEDKGRPLVRETHEVRHEMSR